MLVKACQGKLPSLAFCPPMMRCFCSTGWTGFPHTGEERQGRQDKSGLALPLPFCGQSVPRRAPLSALGSFLFLLPFTHTLCLWPFVSLFSLFLFISSWGFSCSFYSQTSHLLSEKGMSGRSLILWIPFSLSPGISLPLFPLLLLSIFDLKLECLSIHFVSTLCACFS